MKYKLPRPVFSETLIKMLEREALKQKMYLCKASAKVIQELKAMCQIIEKSGLPEYLVLKKLPEPMGYGIFLHPKAKPLKKGKVLGSYGGEAYVIPQNLPDESAYAFAPMEDLILKKDEQKHLDPKRDFHPSRKYIFNIDAEKEGNFTRFINHSEKPNILARLLIVPKNKSGLTSSPMEVIYSVKKTINPGEQLLVSYEDGEESYWSVLKIKPEPIFPNTFTIDENLNLIDHRKK